MAGMSNINLLSLKDKPFFKDGMYKPVVIQNRTIDVRQPHDCNSSTSVTLCCIDSNGMYIATSSMMFIPSIIGCHYELLMCLGTEHSIDFAYCGCEPLVATLVRARLWPSTPKYPHMAFSFDLFDWAEALLLECQVSLKDLCSAFHIKCPHLVTKVSRHVLR